MIESDVPLSFATMEQIAAELQDRCERFILVSQLKSETSESAHAIGCVAHPSWEQANDLLGELMDCFEALDDDDAE